MGNSWKVELLTAAVEHWRDNLKMAKDGTLSEDNVLADSCPLCLHYEGNDETEDNFHCEDQKGNLCPIETSERGQCWKDGNPWRSVKDLIKGGDRVALIVACEAELSMLEGLLKEAEGNNG